MLPVTAGSARATPQRAGDSTAGITDDVARQRGCPQVGVSDFSVAFGPGIAAALAPYSGSGVSDFSVAFGPWIAAALAPYSGSGASDSGVASGPRGCGPRG